ncbi:hypothetical protein NHX12_033534 [Muraenolepis orangiensis]|uniref:Uncharacterized protein n=1 Tax=Muraenolepis orangiensis TaxID=630683 RepID=A0A9Q0IIS9_9TELE|nr:hypothetical protein NHX12_033534 [Muraenolepis orangiensis]
MWNQPDSGEPLGQVSARMETTPGIASISVSQQQAPKKFAPVVAPKPKFNPYKGDGDAGLLTRITCPLCFFFKKPDQKSRTAVVSTQMFATCRSLGGSEVSRLLGSLERKRRRRRTKNNNPLFQY